ncbi:MAG: 16S rRNA (cytidine(1402)-2'-O)-methyltransferase [Alphaproteobacteria bacterium]
MTNDTMDNGTDNRSQALSSSGAPLNLTVGDREIAPGLHLVATPIGNLRDISLRALDTLISADQVFCEDTRMTAKLLGLYGLKRPLSAYHDHNGPKIRPQILRTLADGQSVALVSDAGTPLVSDPGYKLVRAVVEAGHTVTATPGASAVLAGLSLSALPSDLFTFAGFLPPKDKARRARLTELANIPGTLIFFESGPRLGDTLATMATELGNRDAAIARELTKRFEEVRRAPLQTLADEIAENGHPKGEIVVVVGPPMVKEYSQKNLDDLLRAALAELRVKDAAAHVAAKTGMDRRSLYQRALELKESP